MSSVVKIISLQFLHGVKDALCGVFLIYSLDLRIQQQQEARRQKIQEARNARANSQRYINRPVPATSSKDLKPKEPRMIGRVFLSAALSSFVWVSVWAFATYLLPTLQHFSKMLVSLVYDREQSEVTHAGMWWYMETALHYTFAALWVMPLYVISKAVNGFWFVDVSDSVYKLFYGRPRAFPSISIAAADLVYGISIQSVFLVQAFVVKHIPLEGIGFVIYAVHMCLLNSLYAFEYKWYNMGMDLKVRLALVDQHWPYFCGFGLPLFLMTNLAFSHYPTVISACIFSILFPFFIVSGTRAMVPKETTAIRLYIFEPSASVCSFLYSRSMRRRS